MTGLLKYRVPLLIFALVFALFNIGLPVVLDFCPMAKTFGAGACPMCHANAPSGRAEINLPAGSCCNAVTVGDRNTSEFEQSLARVLTDLRLHDIVAPAQEMQSAPMVAASEGFSLLTSSPPLWIDIPILGSSLLI